MYTYSHINTFGVQVLEAANVCKYPIRLKVKKGIVSVVRHPKRFAWKHFPYKHTLIKSEERHHK
jgi:hypothetical protein